MSWCGVEHAPLSDLRITSPAHYRWTTEPHYVNISFQCTRCKRCRLLFTCCLWVSKITTSDQGRLELQRGPWKAFSRDPSSEKILEFCLLKRWILVYFIFLSNGGGQMLWGQDNLPPTPPPLSCSLPVTDVLAVWTTKPLLRLSGPDCR